MNGYRLPVMPLQELMAFRNELHDKMAPIVYEEKAMTIALVASKILDTVCVDKDAIENLSEHFGLELEKHTVEVASKLYCVSQHRQVRLSGIRNPMFDFSFELIFIPIKDAILALAYTERDKLLEVFEKHKSVLPYEYYDHTDKPDDVSTKAWKARAKAWEEAFAKHDVAPLAGLSNQLVGLQSFDVPAKDVLKHTPSMEIRLYSIARRRVLTERMPNEKVEKMTDEEMYDEYQVLNIWMEQEEEGKAKIKEIMDEVQPLIPEMTEELLDTKVGDLL